MKSRAEVLAQFLAEMPDKLRGWVENLLVAVHSQDWKSAARFAGMIMRECLQRAHGQIIEE